MGARALLQRVVIGLLIILLITCTVAVAIGLAFYDRQSAKPNSTSAAAMTVYVDRAQQSITPSIIEQSISLIPTVSPATLVDPVWARIQSSEKIVVGMSAEYPPLSSSEEGFTIQGYDLALITEIGRRLGYPLEVRNMPFNDLFSALQLNEIDIAVAAISLSEARDSYVNFSIVYYVGEDAVLAQEDSPIVIDDVDDLPAYRVGVQQGSVYEKWMRERYIDRGLMNLQNLYLFPTPIEAADALAQENSEIDLVLVDSLPAEIAEKSGDVKIIARNLNPQLYALAIPNGAGDLQARLNEAMMHMQQDGTLSLLARRYLRTNQVLPIGTPPQDMTVETPFACQDDMELVSELNHFEDASGQPPQFGPGILLQKGWRIRNTGTCTWESGYKLAYTGSSPVNSPVGGNPVLVQGAVAPGQTYDVYATLTTPYAEGVYRSFWALQNPENNNVGERIWAEFEVVSQESATPQSEAPQIYSFVVSPFQILSGSCVNVSWSYGGEGVMSSRLFRNGEKILFDIPLSGSYSDCPTQDGYNEYRLIIDSDNYGSTTALQFVDVIPGPQPTIAPQPTLTPTRTESPPGSAPVIDYFTSDAVIIRVGECVDLHWSFSGDSLSNTRLYRDHILLADRLYSPGTLNDCPLLPGRIEYRLIVDSSCCGSTEKSLYISVHHFSITPIKKIDE